MEGYERGNFDQKLQKYYSNQRNVTVQAPNQNLASLIEDHCVDTLALREANYHARRRITDLESELTEIKAKKEIEASFATPQRGYIGASPTSKGSGNGNFESHIDENRKLERAATLAIAEHDALLIRRLEAEVISLRSQHELDVRLMKDAAERVANLKMEKEEVLSRLQNAEAVSSRLATQIMVLTNHVQNTESLVESQRKEHSITLDTITSQRKAESQVKNSSKRPSINSSIDEFEVLEKSMSGRVTTLNPNNNGNRISNMTSIYTSLKHSTNNYSDGQVSPMSLMSVESHLRIENGKLLESLERERALLRRQEDALNHVRASAEEITILEAEEIARLESELDKCVDLKDEWERRCKSALLQIKQINSNQNVGVVP